jgi:hypothetical protein
MKPYKFSRVIEEIIKKLLDSELASTPNFGQ